MAQAPTDTEEKPAQTCLVPYLDPATAPAAVTATLDSLPYRRNIFLLLGNASGLFPPLMSVYGAVFNGETRKIPLLDWQLVVLRIAARLGAPYPWEANEPVARLNGMSQAKIDSMGASPEVIENDVSAIWTERDRSIIKLVDEQLKSYTNDPETVRGARRHLSVEELVEVFIIIGVYTLIARITKGLHIDLDGEIPGLEEGLKRLVTK
ncbi:hypothetical protein MMC16_007099 [Acarospora aff. strigata]|nr:hypothetical protein [Acarospora aff. strigata]